MITLFRAYKASKKSNADSGNSDSMGGPGEYGASHGIDAQPRPQQTVVVVPQPIPKVSIINNAIGGIFLKVFFSSLVVNQWTPGVQTARSKFTPSQIRGYPGSWLFSCLSCQ